MTFNPVPKPVKAAKKRKRTPWKRPAKTVEAQQHLAAVKSLPCCICGRSAPSDAHHCVSKKFGGKRSTDFETIPLCKKHHQVGPDAIHNDKAAWEARNGLDTDYIEATNAACDTLS